MRNPVAILFEQMGLDPGFIAKQRNVDPEMLAGALGPLPHPEVVAYIKAIGAIGAKIRVPGEKFSFWVDVSAIDALFADNNWRKKVGLCWLPGNTGELKWVLKSLRQRDGHTSEYIVDYMGRHLIPNGIGERNWRVQMIDRQMPKSFRVHRKWFRIGRRKVSEEIMLLFRIYMAAQLMVETFPQDPAASLRYKMEPEFIGDRLVITARELVPCCVAKWMRAALLKLKWFPEGKWGIGDQSQTPTQVSPTP